MHDNINHNNTSVRLKQCFQTVFPSIPESAIAGASQATVEEWDSVATITLANVIEEEFGVQLDYDLLPELDTFENFQSYLRTEKQLP